MRHLYKTLNPIASLGNKNYSWKPAFLVTLGSAALLEFVATFLLKNPEAIRSSAIFLFVAYIIYFSFRDGLKGGYISVGVTLMYYLYIIASRGHDVEVVTREIQTTLILGLLYFFIASIIGWLRQNIDTLIEKEAEGRQRLKAIVQQLPVGVIITNKKGQIELANQNAEKILGRKIKVGHNVLKQPLMNAYQLKQQLAFENLPLVRVLNNGEVISGTEYVIKPHRREKYLLVNAAPILNDQNKMIAAASIFSDITLSKEIEQRKDDFVNMASHELKTPITSMKLFLTTLESRLSGSGDEKSIRILRGLNQQTSRLQNLVSDLLDVSRLQTGKLSINKEIFILEDLIQEIVEGLDNDGNSAKRIAYQRSSKTKIIADRFRISQVIANLITNALKYSREEIVIKVAPGEQNNQVVVSVVDKGIGIPKDKQSRIFEKLYQVSEDKENTFPGFGMGLYISKEIIARHKGKIWVESQKGEGATFSFSLPLNNPSK